MRARARIMGMPIAVEVRDAGADPAWAEAVFAWLREVDATFSPYRPDSAIARLAAAEAGGAAGAARAAGAGGAAGAARAAGAGGATRAPGDPGPLVREVLARCERARADTRGYFDARAGGRLDPSGLVKGWAVDRAAALLAAAGARDFCVTAGGDVRTAGGPWRVGVRHPRRPGRLAAVLTVADAAVATSGAYERGDHVLDPHTGRPARGAACVTVVGPELATADAYATAAFAMGEAGPAWTAGLDGYEAMTVLGERVLSTPGFARLCGGGSIAAGLNAGRRRSRGWSRRRGARPRA